MRPKYIDKPEPDVANATVIDTAAQLRRSAAAAGASDGTADASKAVAENDHLTMD